MVESDPATGDVAFQDPDSVVLVDRDFDTGGLVPLRHQVREQVARTGVGDLALYRFVVAINELTTNAVRHGGGAGHLALWLAGGRLHCRVSDRGSGIPAGTPVESPPNAAVAGRGLWLVRQLCDDMAVRSDGAGTVVRVTGPRVG